MATQCVTGDLRVEVSDVTKARVKTECDAMVQEFDEWLEHHPKNHIIAERLAKVNLIQEAIDYLTKIAKAT